MSDLDINVSGDGRRRVLALAGSCDLAEAPALREALVALTTPDVTEVIVDLTELEFLDSTGLGVLLGGVRRLRESGGELKLAGPTRAVKRLLEVTGVDGAVGVYESVAAATT